MSSQNSEKTVENVKARLLEEGREARNLVAFSVPVQEKKLHTHTESRIKTASRDLKRLSVEVLPTSKAEKRPRSASAGRDPQASLRARHWGFLFRNLQQAVDEIYQTCEGDDSVIECKEAILILERYTNDFYKLIEWLKLKWAYENTPPPQRPHSLSWEIRTSSPSKRAQARRKNMSLFETRKWKPSDATPPEKLITKKLEIHNATSDACVKNTFQKSEAASGSSDKTNAVNSLNVLEGHTKEKPSQIDTWPGKAYTKPNPCLPDIPETPLKVSKSPSASRKQALQKPTRPKNKSTEKEVGSNESNQLEKGLSTSASESHIVDTIQFPLPNNPIRSKSATNLKSVPHKHDEGRKPNLDFTKNSLPKSAPTVNMNKASQVRQAYNQSRTPAGGSRKAPPKGQPVKSSVRKYMEPISQQKRIESHKKFFNDRAPALTRSATTLTDSRFLKQQTENERTVSLAADDLKMNGDSFSSTCSLASTSSSAQSWADKVRGTPKSQSGAQSQASLGDKEDEGWEVVRRGRRSGSSTSLNSPSAKSCKTHSFRIQNRFNQPTSAVSMPSLVQKKKEENKRERKGSLKKFPKDTPKKKKKVPLETDEPQEMSKETADSVVDSLKQETVEDGKRKKNLSNSCKKQQDRRRTEGLDIPITQYVEKKSADIDEHLLNDKQEKTPETKSPCETGGNESDLEEEEMSKNEEAWQTAVEEELRLKKEIEAEENVPIEVLVEDETEASPEGGSTIQNEGEDQKPVAFNEWDYFSTSLSWAEQMDLMTESHDVARSPGRVLYIHEKLSSPSRKLTIWEKQEKHLNRLAKAQELRERLIQNKTEKLKDLFKRIDEVNSEKDRLLWEKRRIFERKMSRAEEKRNKHLQKIVTKAHDEDNKAKEIAFINGLEAQNKLHDILQQHQSLESRLADMAEERSRKQEEKAAKETAAQERRKAIEAERQARMAELCEKRRRRCERIDRQQAERREELLEQAREKARDREERLSALQQAQQAKETELVKKIQQKQEETARRHEENIELIKQRAFESSVTRCLRGCDDAPELLKYETKKLCTLCNSLIASEVYLLSHLKGKQHQQALKESCKEEMSNEQATRYNLKHIIDAPENIDDPQVTRDKERQKALKKRCRKIRARMIAKAKDFFNDFKNSPAQDAPTKGRMAKALQQVNKLMTTQGTGPWPTPDVALLDRNLLELQRALDKSSSVEQQNFLSLNGFTRLSELLSLVTIHEGHPSVIPPKSIGFCLQVLISACTKCPKNCLFVLESNIAGNIVDQLIKRFMDLSQDVVKRANASSLGNLSSDPAVTGFMELLARVLEVLAEDCTETKSNATTWSKIQDVVSYCVCVGVLDKVTWYFNRVQSPVDNDQLSTEFILSSMKLLASLTKTLINKSNDQDPTQLIGTIQVTECYGVVSLLYGILLHQTGRSTAPPPEDHLSASTQAITEASTTLLYNIAELDLKVFQGIMGSEGISLELRHICSFLLWYCSHWPSDSILHNVITLVGFFTVGNKENQCIVQSGETPSVLQQLCSLPWKYFSNAKLTAILLPTLVASCMDNDHNIDIIQQEMSIQVLEDFMNKKEAPEKTLVRIIQKSWIKNPRLTMVR